MSRKNLIWADKRDLNKDLSGKTYIVTGANSGVGFETTKQLIKQGAHVVMACRRVDAAKEVVKDFQGLKGSFNIIRLDLADLQSVRDFASKFLEKYDKLNGLDCNAGMVNMSNDIKRTKDNLELTIGISYFGHFLLTELLIDILKKTPDSRMVILSSVVHAGSKKNRYDIHFDDLNYNKRKFNNFQAYGEAKVAAVLYAKELADRLKDSDVTTFSVHPGWARSNFGSGGNAIMKVMMALMKPFLPFISDSSYESAQTSLHCLLSDNVKKHSGEYFSQSSILYSDKECRDGGWPMKSPNPNARDMNKAKKLVKESYKIVGLEV
jgi:NAD(P)-dependent dehydrogenase (short-subunit alcohol dehydrogenase family)